MKINTPLTAYHCKITVFGEYLPQSNKAFTETSISSALFIWFFLRALLPHLSCYVSEGIEMIVFDQSHRETFSVSTYSQCFSAVALDLFDVCEDIIRREMVWVPLFKCIFTLISQQNPLNASSVHGFSAVINILQYVHFFIGFRAVSRMKPVLKRHGRSEGGNIYMFRSKTYFHHELVF